MSPRKKPSGNAIVQIIHITTLNYLNEHALP